VRSQLIKGFPLDEVYTEPLVPNLIQYRVSMPRGMRIILTRIILMVAEPVRNGFATREGTGQPGKGDAW